MLLCYAAQVEAAGAAAAVGDTLAAIGGGEEEGEGEGEEAPFALCHSLVRVCRYAPRSSLAAAPCRPAARCGHVVSRYMFPH
jgi:hypothetical protein